MKGSKRITKDEYYLQIAKAVALRSICIESRRGFGAIIVINDTIVSTGYAGPARGIINCNEIGGCCRNILKLNHNNFDEYCPSVHAEENTVINAARHGSRVLDGVMFALGVDKKGDVELCSPCPRCKRVLINAGIKEVVTMDKNGKIIRYNVKDWVEEDSKAYIDNLEKIKETK
jgi:dCMP deaminase